MSYEDVSVTWAFAKAKTAALYFDKVHIIDKLWLDPPEQLEELREQLLLRQGRDASTIEGLGIGVGTGVHIFNEKLLEIVSGVSKSLMSPKRLQKWEWSMSYLTDSCLAARSNLDWLRFYLQLRLALEKGTLLGGSTIYPSEASPVSEGEVGTPSLVLTWCNVVDPEALSWDQIFELRQDASSIRKLQRLRLFLHEKYDGENLDYLRRDLLTRIEEYEATVTTSMGAPLQRGFLAALLDKDTLTSAAIALVALAEGAPVAALGAAIPLFAKVGSVALETKRTRDDFHHLEGIRDPVAFLCDVKARSGAA